MTLRLGVDATPLHKPLTGVGQYTYRLLKALGDSYPEADYVLYTNRKPAGLALPLPQAELVAGHFPFSRWLWLHLILPGLVLEDRPALLHFPNASAPIAVRLPYVLTIHDLSLFRHPGLHPRGRHVTMRTLLPQAARRSAAVICVSEFTRLEARRVLGLSAESLHVVPLAAGPEFRPITDAASCQRIRSEYGLPDRFLLFVGTLEPRKNLDRLLRACAILRAMGHALPLVIAGKMGWHMKSFQSEVQSLGLEDHVLTLGYVRQDHLPCLYSLATAFVFPSLYEGFGLPVLEAMACGTPVIMSNRPAHNQTAGDAAMSFDPEDEAAMADGIRQMLSSHETMEEYRRRGLVRAAEFSWRRAAEQTYQVYQRALSGG